MWQPLRINQLWEMLQSSNAENALLKKHLSEERMIKLKNVMSSAGGTLVHCINAGCHDPGYGMGVYATDPDAYDVFGELFLPIIKEYHNLADDFCHPPSDFGDPDNVTFKEIDPEGKFIISTRVRVGRSHEGYPFPPLVTEQYLTEMERKSREALYSLSGDLSGTYHALSDLATEVKAELVKEHYLFPLEDSYLDLKGGRQFWDIGRGIFFNANKTFVAWVNEEDHLRLISMETGADMTSVYRRLSRAALHLESCLRFARTARLGYLAFCPSNLGTTLRASVHVRLPLFSKQKDFRSTCDQLNLQIRGTYGVRTEAVNDVYDISNKRRLGMTELSVVREMWHGIEALLDIERKLQSEQCCKRPYQNM